MKRISTTTRVVDKFGAGKDGYTDGDVIGGVPATDLEAALFDNLQEELATIPEAAGLVLNGAVRSQVADGLRRLGYCVAVAGGAADAITAAFTPTLSALPTGAGLNLTMRLVVRAAAANATTTPTFNPDGTGAKTIVKGNNLALVAGDIAGAGHWLELQYDATLTKFVLLNPAKGVTALTLPQATETVLGGAEIATQAELNAGASDAVVSTPLKLLSGFSANFAGTGHVALPTWLGGWKVQWGQTVATVGSGSVGTNTFSTTWGSVYGIALIDNAQASNNAVVWCVDATNLANFTAFWNASAATPGSTTRVARYVAIGK